ANRRPSASYTATVTCWPAARSSVSRAVPADGFGIGSERANPPGSDDAPACTASSHPLTNQPAAPSAPRAASALPSFVKGKLADAATPPPKVPRRTWYVYVPAGAAPGTCCVSVRTTVAPAGSVTV